MASPLRSTVTAVLGPTNTGKTHLAIERMCGHSSGLIGFPLRLLAREVYDRVVRIKGPDQVALMTGEERIVPRNARWFLTTAESMPLEGVGDLRDFAFVALDEVQLASEPERGHVFTDRLLHARGREETMLLGSATMSGAIRDLVPGAEIVSRPRFSTLSYSGAHKLSRLPRRSAIVAFSAEEVYAVAEMLRRFRGGAAVVMGALSPRTRNAQVAMFQAGEVDYLVATDAIGMGLNMDVDHVAFASLTKFDGRRQRRLRVTEMAQIAGRAGRHQKDGTFGVIGGMPGAPELTPDEIERIEEHRFPPVEELYWRDGAPSFGSVDALIASLERRPAHERLRPAPEATDLAVLRALADRADVRDRARGAAQVRRLWDVCSLPDFQKLGTEHHARLVHTLWQYLGSGNGHIPPQWFAGQIARLDNVQGDVETLAGRIAAARVWAYAAQRSNWLADPAEMVARTLALEERLSDALHAALTQRFVDKRTTVLLRDIGRDASLLAVDVDPTGLVTVDGQGIGRLTGFRFQVDPQARAAQKRLLIAAAERRLGKVLTERAQAVLTASDGALRLVAEPGGEATVQWEDVALATLRAGARLLQPEVVMDAGVSALPTDLANAVKTRVEAWMEAQLTRHIPALVKMDSGSSDPATPAPVRAVLAQMTDAGGVLDRATLDSTLVTVEKTDRTLLRKSGVVIGALDLYHPGLMKPGAALWRMVLLQIRRAQPLVPLPAAGAVLLSAEAVADPVGAEIAGFRRFGEIWLRIDIAERIARAGHEAIAANRPYEASDPHIVSIGLSAEAFNELMRQAGFRRIAPAPVAHASEEASHETPEAVAEVIEVPEPEAVAETPAEEPAQPGEPVPTIEASTALSEEAPSGESETPAVEAVATGANWIFRGRPKPRPDRRPGNRQRHAPSGRRNEVGGDGHERRRSSDERGPRGPRPDRAAGEQPQRDGRGGDDRRNADGPRGGRPHGSRPQGDRPQRDRAQGDRPRHDKPRGDRREVPVGAATSKALAGLADLLKRDD